MNEYEEAELAELEDQAEFLRNYPHHAVLFDEKDGWELLTRIVAFLLCVLGILLIWNWK